MAVNAAQLLRQLEPAVRAGAIAPPTNHAAAFESQTFDQLLSQASKGSISSGRQIEVSCNAQPPLAPSQLEQLAAAADVAEASGAKRALMMIDGRGFVMDVQARTIVAEIGGNSPAGILQVDAAMRVGQDDHAGHLRLHPPGNGMIPPGAAKQLLSTAKL